MKADSTDPAPDTNGVCLGRSQSMETGLVGQRAAPSTLIGVSVQIMTW